MSTKSALLWTFFWIVLSLLFNVLVYVFYEHHWLGIGIGTEYAPALSGTEAAIAFFTAYIIEKSLSIDNIFVIAMIFSYFQVPPRYQHRVLFWGILGALFMRGIMIFGGIAAIERWSFITYILGGLLIITAIRMMVVQQDKLRPEKNMAIRLVGKYFPLTKDYFGHRFLVKLNSRWTATPLFLALILIESTDLLFAVDSIPAVLAITLDPFIVLSSNIFAILGMRSLYFALASLLDRFCYLKQSMIFILSFVGIKLILAPHVAIEPLAALWVILGILGIGIFASLLAVLEETFLDKSSQPSNEMLFKHKRHKRSVIWRVFFLSAVLTFLATCAMMVIMPKYKLLSMVVGLLALFAEYYCAKKCVVKKHTK